MAQTAALGSVFVMSFAGCLGPGATDNTSTPDTRVGWAFLMGSSDVTTSTYTGVAVAKGVSDAANVPGARDEAGSCVDPSGNFWIFGGYAAHPGSAGVKSDSNDLWKFDGKNWTWVSGGATGNNHAVYGTMGVADPSNVPGAGEARLMWCDRSGNIWLFGGTGYDTTSSGYLNDLWKFDGANWTWMGGSNTINQPAVYGTKGVSSPANIPDGRWDARSTLDKNGVLWMFGGTNAAGQMSDLWKFDGTNWTWVSGTTAGNTSGVYGTKRLANPANNPGGRDELNMIAVDSSNNVWIQGGWGRDKAGTAGNLGDLWKFNGTSWAWMGGSDTVNLAGVYGTKGVADSVNSPGGRNAGIGWIDDKNNVWLYSGSGQDGSGGADQNLQDLWKFDGTNWTWVSGDTMGSRSASYGTAGVVDQANHPAGFWYPLFSYDSVRHTVWTLGGWAVLTNGGYSETSETWRLYTGGLN